MKEQKAFWSQGSVAGRAVGWEEVGLEVALKSREAGWAGPAGTR